MYTLVREQLLEKVFARIDFVRPQSLTIIGDIHIGKTTLLHQVLDRYNRQKYLQHVDQYRFYYFDIKDLREGHLSILEDIVKAFSHPGQKDGIHGENVYDRLTNCIAGDWNKNTAFIVILDNFHLLTLNRSVPEDFFSYLRSLANRYQFAYILSSIAPLTKLCARKEVEGSPFFNIFSNIELRTFTDHEANLFLSGSGKSVPYDVVKGLSGSHPYLMQQVLDLMSDQRFSQNMESIKKVLIKRNKSFVEELINSSPEYYPEVFLKLAQGIKPGEREFFLVRPLIKKGYADENFRLTSEIIIDIVHDMNGGKQKASFLGKIRKWF